MADPTIEQLNRAYPYPALCGFEVYSRIGELKGIAAKLEQMREGLDCED